MEVSSQVLYFPLDLIEEKYQFILVLWNRQTHAINFKVKTTHPHDLTCDPRTGRIDSGGRTELGVTWSSDAVLESPNDFSGLSPPSQPRLLIEQHYQDADSEDPKPIILSSSFTSPSSEDNFYYKLNGEYHGSPPVAKRFEVVPKVKPLVFPVPVDDKVKNGEGKVATAPPQLIDPESCTVSIGDLIPETKPSADPALQLTPALAPPQENRVIAPQTPIPNAPPQAAMSQATKMDPVEDEWKLFLRERQMYRETTKRSMDQEARERAELQMRERSVQRMRVLTDQACCYYLAQRAREGNSRECGCTVS